MLWVLTDPEGKAIEETASLTRDTCWSRSWWTVADALGPEWARRYNYRWEPSMRNAAEKGYKIKRAKLVVQK